MLCKECNELVGALDGCWCMPPEPSLVTNMWWFMGEREKDKMRPVCVADFSRKSGTFYVKHEGTTYVSPALLKEYIIRETKSKDFLSFAGVWFILDVDSNWFACSPNTGYEWELMLSFSAKRENNILDRMMGDWAFQEYSKYYLREK